MLVERGTDLWTHEEPLRTYGIEVGRVMSVVRLPGGELWIHSPAELTARLRAALDELGTVRYVVAANRFHGHRYMAQYRAAYPDVRLFSAPGLARRRSDLAFDGLLGSSPDPRWAESVDQIAVTGFWLVEEVEFYHRPSRTLLVGDLLYNLRGDLPLSTEFFARTRGVYGRVAVPRDVRFLLRNEGTARRAVERLLDWEFDRVVVGHGEIVESGGRDAVRGAFEWLVG